MLKFAQFALVASLIIGLTTAWGQQEAASLQNVCENKKVSLKSISQVKQMIDELRRERPENCDPYLTSFLELEPILKVVESGQVCNLDMTNMLRDYHYTHINGKERKNKDDKIANPLRYFFISLCFQISAECKITLINSLENDTKDKISDEDYKTIDLLEQYGASLLDKNTKVEDFDDILLLSDINSAVGIDAEAKDTKLLVKVKTSLMLKNLVGLCLNKFRPFYEKLILPLVMLSNLGYNYKGELLSREIQELKNSQLVGRWYNIVQTCEAFKAIDIFEDDETVLEDQRAITLISKEEANEIKSKNIANNGESLDDPSNVPLIYEPAPSHNSDDLWIQDQKELDRLVNKYKASATEADRIKNKLMNKLFDKFKESLKQGKIKMFASGILDGMSKDKNNKMTNINEDIVSMMDNVITKTDEKTTVNLIDEPVSGGRVRYPPRKPGHGPRPIPNKIVAVSDPVDQSKTLSDRLFERTIGRFLPSKMDMFIWFVGIIGIMMIITACLMG